LHAATVQVVDRLQHVVPGNFGLNDGSSQPVSDPVGLGIVCDSRARSIEVRYEESRIVQDRLTVRICFKVLKIGSVNVVAGDGLENAWLHFRTVKDVQVVPSSVSSQQQSVIRVVVWLEWIAQADEVTDNRRAGCNRELSLALKVLQRRVLFAGDRIDESTGWTALSGLSRNDQIHTGVWSKNIHFLSWQEN